MAISAEFEDKMGKTIDGSQRRLFYNQSWKS